MMTEFLLEIYGEEIPSWGQRNAEKELKGLIEEFLVVNKIVYSKIEVNSSSRRVSLSISQIEKETPKSVVHIRGPRVDANENALKGFLNKNNSKFEDLIKKKVKNKEYLFLEIKSPKLKVEKILQQNLPKILGKVRWKKSMRWNNFDEKWIRPIKSILCIFYNKKIVFKYGGVTSSNFSFGNYHYGEKKIIIKNTKTYEKDLEKNHVILSRVKRENMISKKLQSFCKLNGSELIENKDLFQRVVDSVEYPNVLFGNFSKKYFDIPEFLLKSVMFEKQDYFCFLKNKSLLNSFAFISSKDIIKKKNIVKGNENVLKARFSDAKFFIREDRKKKLEERIIDLKGIIFFRGAGNLHQRAERIKKTILFISKKMNLDLEKFYKYLNLSNADLTCELVKEFPSLQGKVGGYYASQENLPKEVYEAFYSQYNLDFPKSDNYLSLLMSISQKVDGILGFFISNEKLSGAGDPFGIRRSALSIIKICIDNSLNLDLIEIFEFLKKEFVEQNISPKVNLEDVINYFRKRILILFADMGYKNEEVQSVLSKNKFNPLQLFNDLKVLKRFIISKNGKDFLKAIKRLISINENSKVQSNINVNIFQSKEEVNLYKCSKYLIKFEQGIDFLEDKNFIILFTKSLNQFFDKVKVNSHDEKLKENRKALISFLYEKVNDIYKFETIIK